jgi:hypothetical protein
VCVCAYTDLEAAQNGNDATKLVSRAGTWGFRDNEGHCVCALRCLRAFASSSTCVPMRASLLLHGSVVVTSTLSVVMA